jgi:hypothetical protein
MRIRAVGTAIPDGAVLPVHEQLDLIASGEGTASLHRVGLCGMDGGGSITALALDSPLVTVGYDMNVRCSHDVLVPRVSTRETEPTTSNPCRKLDSWPGLRTRSAGNRRRMRTMGQAAVCLQKAHDIVRSMPSDLFTTADFLSRAISMNAVDHCNDVLPMIDHLTEVGAVMPMDSTGTAWLRTDGFGGDRRALEPSWRVVAERELAGRLAAPVARAVVRTTIDDVLDDDDLNDAILVASELVTNAVLHTSGPVHLTVSRDQHADRARIAVRDLEPDQLPTLRHPAPGDLGGGRGLRVVDALATWGTTVDVAHKEVWAEVPKPSAPAITQTDTRRR